MPRPLAPSPISELNARSREIFRMIVDGYVQTGEPIGSRTLSRLLTDSLSPATIRNVMADLEEAGLLYSPHTSAGRLPTEAGLRFFVDGLLEVGNLAEEERHSIESMCAARGKSLPQALEEATTALSGLSHCAGLVVVPKQDRPLKHLEFVPLGPGRALVVMVTEDGLVENRVIEVPLGLPPSALISATNFLTARLVGRTIEEARTDIEGEIASNKAQLDEVTGRVVATGLASWAGGDADRALDRARPGQPARRRHRGRRPRTAARPFRGAGNPRDDAAFARCQQTRRRGADFHRRAKPSVRPCRMLADHRALSEQPRGDRRRDRRHRPDAHQLRPDHSDGGLHRKSDRASDWIESMSDEREEAVPANDAANDTGAAPERDAAPATPEERIAELEAELAEGQDKLLRALAETENVRRRAQRERQDAEKYSVAKFAGDLLSTADNLRRALDSLPESEAKDDRTKNLLAGVAATERELLAAFERHGLKRVEAMGERFDHNFHQAVFEMENTGRPAGTVVEVLQPGYMLHDRLLRPAMVGVAKGGAPAPTPDAPEGTDDGA